MTTDQTTTDDGFMISTDATLGAVVEGEANPGLPSTAFLRGALAGLEMSIGDLRKWVPMLLDEIDRLNAALVAQITDSTDPSLLGLTFVERQLLQYLRDTSLTLPQIAAERGVSINTVKTQARILYRKLKVERRHDLRSIKL